MSQHTFILWFHTVGELLVYDIVYTPVNGDSDPDHSAQRLSPPSLSVNVHTPADN